MTTPHIGLVAEQGAESIIPLSPEKRARGRDLWMQTGQMLGIPAYADGGIFGDDGDDGDEPTPIPLLPTTTQGGAPAVMVQMEVHPVFQIEGGTDEEEVVAIIKARLKEMVDDISDELAERLARIFANLPVKA